MVDRRKNPDMPERINLKYLELSRQAKPVNGGNDGKAE